MSIEMLTRQVEQGIIVEPVEVEGGKVTYTTKPARRVVTYPEEFAPVTGEVDIEAQTKIEQATEPQVIGVTEEGTPIIQQIPQETQVIGPVREQLYAMQREPTIVPTRTLTETIYPYSPELAGFVGSYEAWVRPEVPTIPGAVMEHLTVRGYPASFLYPEYMQPPKKKKAKDIPEELGEPIAIAPRDPYAELKQLGPRYVLGELAGEASQFYLLYKAGEKLFPSKKKVVTEATHILPREEPYAWLGKEPSKTMLMPMEEAGRPLGYKITVEPGVKTPFRAVVSGGQQLLMVEEQLPKMTVTAIPRAAYAEKELAKQMTRGAVKLVSTPSTASKIFPFVGIAARELPRAWQREPYPGTKVKVEEEVEFVSYEGVEAPTRLKPSPLYHQLRRLEKLPKTKPIAETKVEPVVRAIPKTVPKQITRTDVKLKQAVRQQQQQMMRQFQVPRQLQIQRGRLALPAMRFRLPRFRSEEARRALRAGYFMRVWPIAEPEDVMKRTLGFKRKKRKRKK